MNDTTPNPVVHEISEHIKNLLARESTGHDWWHSERVRKAAVYICKHEGGNRLIIECSALLHDIDDWKFIADRDETPRLSICDILSQSHIEPNIIHSISEIIDGISFKGAGAFQPQLSLEGQIVQDADRLDALGAIGIARAFAYGGYKRRPIFDPDVSPYLHRNFEEYKSKQSTTVNHFFEKLLLLKDRMNTPTGKHLAERRHQFISNYLQIFMDEWNGSDMK